MKKLKKTIQKILREQDFPGDPFDKDISGECLNKSLVNIPTNFAGPFDNAYQNYTDYVDAGQANMPFFEVTDQAAEALAELLIETTSLGMLLV